jgi:hypothetical protein
MTNSEDYSVDDWLEDFKKKRENGLDEPVKVDTASDCEDGEWFYEDGAFVLQKPGESESYHIPKSALKSEKEFVDWVDHVSKKVLFLSDQELGELIRLMRKVKGSLHPNSF